MKLRKLDLKDAPLMLEWMHDDSVVNKLQTNFKSKTIDDCENFIKHSWNDEKNVHYAIVDEDDVYLGTVSIKNIVDNTGEFAITIRAAAMGKGVGQFGMKEIIRVGLEELKLDYIYWCVSPDNIRAVRFYDKNGYERVSSDDLNIQGTYKKEQIEKYLWYKVSM